jgi:N-acetylglucosamine-6-phosphate deacetylase
VRAIVGGTVVAARGTIDSGTVVMDGGSIQAVGDASDVPLPPGTEVVDAAGRWVIPGLVDVHFHGLLGHDVQGPGLTEVIRNLPRFGVTSFMATTLTLPWDETRLSLRSMADQLARPPAGAECLGIHIEGPFLSPLRPGMAQPDWLEPLSWDRFQVHQEASAGLIRMVTFAPEAGAAMSVIPRLVEAGVIPVIGHTDATFEQATEAIRLGASQATHTYNAMRPLHHREPGTVGAVMYDDTIYAEMIGDGLHVHPAAMAILVRAKGLDRVLLISDAAPVAGLPPGEYEWGHRPVFVREGGLCELANGTIAGAHALLDDGLRRLVREVGLPLADAVVLASRTPARSVNRPRKGVLEAGADADLVVLDDDLAVAMTFVAGDLLWHAD